MNYVLRGIIEKRKKINEDVEDEYEELFRGRRRNIIGEVCNEDDLVELASTFVPASRPQKRRRRGRKIERDKSWWENGYLPWDDEVFRHHLRISPAPFEILVDPVRAYLQKTPTNACPDPISPEKQLALTLYRLAHGTFYLTTGALFGVSEEHACITFNDVCRVIVATLYDIYVKLPDDWKDKSTGFIENYSFPCVGVWDGFHKYVETKLKS